MSLSLLPGIISAAIVSVKSVIAVCTPRDRGVEVLAMRLIATFMLVRRSSQELGQHQRWQEHPWRDGCRR